MNPNASRPPNLVYYCELSEPRVPQRDSLGSAPSLCVNPERKTIATQVSNLELIKYKEKKKSLWAKLKHKLLSPIIKWWWKRNKVPPKETPQESVLEYCGLNEISPAKEEEATMSKSDQAIFSSPLSGRSYSFKKVGGGGNNVEAAFWKLNESVCAPLAVSTEYTDLLAKICGASTFGAKKINLRVLKNLVEDHAHQKTVEKRLVTKMESLETVLDSLLRIHGNREQNIAADCQKPSVTPQAAPNFICENLPAFTSSISDTFALQKCLKNEVVDVIIENTTAPEGGPTTKTQFTPTN